MYEIIIIIIYCTCYNIVYELRVTRHPICPRPRRLKKSTLRSLDFRIYCNCSFRTKDVIEVGMAEACSCWQLVGVGLSPLLRPNGLAIFTPTSVSVSVSVFELRV